MAGLADKFAQPLGDWCSAGRPLAIFVLSFWALQCGWNDIQHAALEHWVIDGATVHAAVLIIHSMIPRANAAAVGSSILAPNGDGMDILKGCDGTPFLFMLIAALLGSRFTWWQRLAGSLAGAVYVFAINQLRLLALFYSLLYVPAGFELLHTVIAPFLQIASAWLFFRVYLHIARGKNRRAGLSTPDRDKAWTFRVRRQ